MSQPVAKTRHSETFGIATRLDSTTTVIKIIPPGMIENETWTEHTDTSARLALIAPEPHTLANPWCNRRPTPDGAVPYDSRTRAEFARVLRDLGLMNNLCGVFGFASQGFGNADEVAAKFDHWCDENDAHFGTNAWILVTQGDGDYQHPSIATLAHTAARRGVPVVFVQSDFGYAEPGWQQWPQYATAGIFGPGVYTHAPDAKGVVAQKKCWGGFQQSEDGFRTGTLSFPDSAILTHEFDGLRLVEHLAGIFVAGGGDITVEQSTEIYMLMTAGRSRDRYVAATSAAGVPSLLNQRFGDSQKSWAACLMSVVALLVASFLMT